MRQKPTEHDHLTQGQVDTLHTLGWRSQAEQRADGRRAFWRRMGIYTLWAAGILLVLQIGLHLNGADQRHTPPGWDCVQCSKQWAGFDWAMAQPNSVTPVQCRLNAPSREWQQGCLYVAHVYPPLPVAARP